MLKKLQTAIIGMAILFPGVAMATPIFVGSWHVGEGPQWSAAVQTAYSGQEAAALLFGGSADDYAISTISDQIGDIDFMAWYDGYGIGMGKLAHDFENGDLYTNGVRSAYILDNSCGVRYSDPNAACADDFINYAFRVSDVPEPAPLALLGLGLGLVGLGMLRKRRA